MIVNRSQRRAMERGDNLTREQRIKRERENNKRLNAQKMTEAARKDLAEAYKLHGIKWAWWVADHLPIPRKIMMKIDMTLHACPLTIVGGMLRWSLARMAKTKLPRLLKTAYAGAVFILAMSLHIVPVAVAAAIVLTQNPWWLFALLANPTVLCYLRAPLRVLFVRPIMWFQERMHTLGMSYRIYEQKEIMKAVLYVRKWGKEVYVRWYPI